MNIVVTAVTFCHDAELRQRAEDAFRGHTLRFAAGDAQALVDANAAIIGRETIDDALLARTIQLKALSLYGVGYDNVDVDACARRGVAFMVAHGVNAAAVAEHTIGLMLASLRNIALNDREIHRGVWNKNGGRTLMGRTVAVVGCGAVGTLVGRLLKAFGCRIVLVDIVPKVELAAQLGATEASLTEALQVADVVSLHVPLTVSTEKMFDEVMIGRMRRGSLLVNTSRGRVVVGNAVKEALQSGHLAGAALDVFEIEPMLDVSFGGLPTLVATPHTAGNAYEAVQAMGQAAIDQLTGHLKLAKASRP